MSETRPAMAGRRLLLLLCWKERGGWYFLRRLRAAGLDVTVLAPFFQDGPRRLARLSLRLSRFYLPVWALFRAGGQDAIASWDLPCTAVMGLLKRFVAPILRLPHHLGRDFHINPTRAGEPRYAAKLRLLGAAMAGVDLALTTSRAEAVSYAAWFGLPRDRFAFFPDAPPSELFAVPPVPVADAVFAYGNSDRDFDTLVAAAGDIPAPVVILSQKYVPAGPLPGNVSLVRDYVSREELTRRIGGAACCVVPLLDAAVAAGQNSMFESMALGRPLVITENVATAEYVVSGKNGLLCPPRDPVALAQAVRSILADPAVAAAMGGQARQDARAWLDRQVAMFLDVVQATIEKADKASSR
jgi:glycosyltransferase involved in cell wall biosynthesis